MPFIFVSSFASMHINIQCQQHADDECMSNDEESLNVPANQLNKLLLSRSRNSIKNNKVIRALGNVELSDWDAAFIDKANVVQYFIMQNINQNVSLSKVVVRV